MSKKLPIQVAKETKVNIYDGRDSDLKKLRKDSPHRPGFEAQFEEEVKRVVTEVRNKRYINLRLIIASLQDPQGQHGFQTWLARLGKVLGKETCAEIGVRVCQEMGFTLQEGEGIKEEWRKQQAQALGLPEDSSWEKIQQATSKK